MRTLLKLVLFLGISLNGFSQEKLFCHFIEQKSGKKHFSFVCDEILSYQEGVALVKLNNQYALLSNSGKVIDKLSVEVAKNRQEELKPFNKKYAILKDKYNEQAFPLFNMLSFNIDGKPCSSYEYKPSVEQANAYAAEWSQYTNLKKIREKAALRIKNASVYDRGVQYTKPRINLLNTLYKEYIISCQNEESFVANAKEITKNEAVVYETNQLQQKISWAQLDKENLKNEIAYIDADVKDEVIPTNIIDKVYDDVDLDQLKSQIDYLKKEADLLKPEFDAILKKCSHENCSDCSGKGEKVSFSISTPQTSTQDVWTAQSGVVNTSTGNVTYSYGFSKQSVTTYSNTTIMSKCDACNGTGKRLSFRCLDVQKYARVIAKYYPNLLTEMSKY
jgi:hypothetical protein